MNNGRKDVFIVRPMSGVSSSEDALRVEEILEKLHDKDPAPKGFSVLNSWAGTPLPTNETVHDGRIWKLGSAIRQLEFADIIILVKGSWKTAKGCAIERRVIEQYFDICDRCWTVYVYDQATKVLTDVTNELRAAHMGIKVD